jgi:hypothetical protein
VNTKRAARVYSPFGWRGEKGEERGVFSINGEKGEERGVISHCATQTTVRIKLSPVTKHHLRRP